MTTITDITSAIEAARHGQSVMTRCPAHDDSTASLHVGPGTEQPVIFKCHAGCEQADVIASSGIDWEEICNPLEAQQERTSLGDATVYPYTDEDGRELFQALRFTRIGGGKDFRQRHREGTEWVWNIQNVRRVLYRLPAVLRAVRDGETVWVMEGEKDVHTALLDGLCATCNPMGAGKGKWLPEYSETLRGADVVIVADADEAGRDHARIVAKALVAVDCHVRVMETTLHGCNDYTDHRMSGGVTATLAVLWDSRPPRQDTTGLTMADFASTTFTSEREVVPHLLAVANVGLVTGYEGHGKTTFLRQFAVQCASGIIPFRGVQMPALRVLFVDAENPEGQQKLDWMWLTRMCERHTGQQFPNDNLIVLPEWRAEHDLSTPLGAAWLFERITAYQPDVCVMGPLRNLSRDVTEAKIVDKVKSTINTARGILGTAFLIEHHCGHFRENDVRSTRPYGHSSLLSWPDFCYGLQPVKDEPEMYDLFPHRGPRVRSRRWMERVQVGSSRNDWAFVEAPPSQSATVYRIGG